MDHLNFLDLGNLFEEKRWQSDNSNKSTEQDQMAVIQKVLNQYFFIYWGNNFIQDC